MVRAALLLLLVCLLGLPAAHAQRRSTGMPVADCDRTDATTVEGVYQCMMTFRSAETDTFSRFERMSLQGCYVTGSFYLQALQASGAADTRRQKRGDALRQEAPTCDILAKALARVQGKMPAWGYCTDYPGRFDAQHMKQCLEGYLPASSRGRTLQSLRGCQEAIDTYERAIRSGAAYHEIERSGTAKEHYFKQRAGIPDLPFNYERPSCEALIATGIVSTAGPQPYRRPDRP